MAGYHDGALLFGKVLRERMLSQQGQKGSYDVPLDVNPFRKISFEGAYDQWQIKISDTMGGRVTVQNNMKQTQT